MPENAFKIEDGVLKKYIGRNETVVIPEGVHTIGNLAFEDCETVRNVVIPDGVTKIGFGAFCNCGELRALTLPDSVTETGDWSFRKCRSLSEIRLSPKLTMLPYSSFEDCISLTRIELPEQLTRIDYQAFQNCENLREIRFPAAIAYIGRDALKNTKWERELKDELVMIHSLLYSCRSPEPAGGELVLRDGIRRIATGAFRGCTGLRSVVIPASVEDIESYAFEGCTGLGSISIPEGVTKIGWGTFSDCTALSRIEVAKSVRLIGARAFHDTAWLNAQPDGPVYINDIFYTWKGTPPAEVTIRPGTRSIGPSAFEKCSSLTAVHLPDSLRELGQLAFEGCGAMKTIRIPAGVEEFGFKPVENMTVICGEGSKAQEYCLKNNLFYLFDYQADHMENYEIIESPFPADEEQPYIFVSYSHHDRERVFRIMKEYYESGWRLWYDEGLNIGQSYDETLEAHIKNCSAFLLFSTKASKRSNYVNKKEIPWAVAYDRPIVVCELDEDVRIPIPEHSGENGTEAFVPRVPAEGVGDALSEIDGLSRGGKRRARGLSVAFDLQCRELQETFAYCLYSRKNAAKAKYILEEIRINGCRTVDGSGTGKERNAAASEANGAATKGDGAAKKVNSSAAEANVTAAEGIKAAASDPFSESACIIAFLDSEAVADPEICALLERAMADKKDIAVYALDEFALPEALECLDDIHWLKYDAGNERELITKLTDYLTLRGCRTSNALPGFEYELQDGGLILTKYTGRKSEVKIEAEYGGCRVLGIGEKAFANSLNLTRIELPDTLRMIGKNAFGGCSGLQSIHIPGSVREIGPDAFSYCTGLRTAVLDEGVQVIGNYAFSQCSQLENVTFPDSLSVIEFHAFSDCTALRTPVFGSGLRKIGFNAFDSCNGIRTVEIPAGVEIETEAFQFCGNLTQAVLSEGIREINAFIFRGCRALLECRIPESVERIGAGAFSGCGRLTGIRIPKYVKSIESEAFAGCLSCSAIEVDPDNAAFDVIDGVLVDKEHTVLKAYPGGKAGSCRVPSGIKTISFDAFKYCRALTALDTNTVEYIGEDAFRECSGLTEIRFGPCLRTIDMSAFSYCKALRELTLPDGLSELQNGAFSDCGSLRRVTLGKEIEKLGSGIFASCASLEEVHFTENPGKLTAWMFARCGSLRKMTIPKGTRSIGEGTFQNCVKLEELEIPATVTSIGRDAFEGCGKLTVICRRGSAAAKYCAEYHIKCRQKLW